MSDNIYYVYAEYGVLRVLNVNPQLFRIFNNHLISPSSCQIQFIIIYFRVQEAAQGTIEAYKTGKSGSVWVVWKKVVDITDKVDEAYDIMKGDWFN